MPRAARAVATSQPQWLVLGSFPFDDFTPGKMLGNGFDFEPRFAPEAGQSFAGRTWVAWDGQIIDFLDARLGFPDRLWCLAYAFTYVHSPRKQTVTLAMGSDDGVAAYVNGRQVHHNDVQRSLSVAQDVVKVTLEAGWNSLLFKISQLIGQWGFTARLDGKGLTYSARRPAGKLFAGLAKARGGLTLNRRPRVELALGRDGLVACFRVSAFNDSDSKARAQGLIVCGDQVLAQSAAINLAPFACQSLEVAAPAGDVLQALTGESPVTIRLAKGDGGAALAIGEREIVDMFFGCMMGFLLPDGAAEQCIPPVFRGKPAMLAIEDTSTTMPERAVTWPDLPARAITPSETATGAVKVDVVAPIGRKNTCVRLSFGDAVFQDSLARARFMLEQLRADALAAIAPARKGLAALAIGDWPSAQEAFLRAAALLEKSLPDRKNQQVALVGHAHIDMNWLWTTSETQQVCHDTFRQVLSFMDEFPQFCFSQSQAATYRYIERLDPAMFERIRGRVTEGRWEVLGGEVTEGDTNLCSGEGLARNFLYGQRYFQDKFARRATVGWLPDNFGHVAQLPQVLKLAGIGSFYGHRCQPQNGPFIWEGIDGSRVVNYITPNYNGEVSPELAALPQQYDPKHGKLMWVYGVGDHGGGPTRRDITRAVAYDKLPQMPAFRFTSAGGFFRSLAPDVADYPVHRGEFQYIFEGCYTSIARVKEGNRRGENLLYQAELLASLMSLTGQKYPVGELYDAWYTLAFNQFHDILCGSATHESNRESVGAYDLACRTADEVRYSSLRYLAARVATAKGDGQPLVVFNPMPAERSDVVEAEVFSHMSPPSAAIRSWSSGSPHPDLAHHTSPAEPIDVGQGKFATVKLTDAAGKAIDAQIVDGKLFPNGYRLKVRFLAKSVPACGVRVYHVRPELPAAPIDSSLQVKGTTITTPLLVVEVDPRTGHVRRIFDRKRKVEVLAKGCPANVLKLYMEKPHGMSAWNIGPISEILDMNLADAVRVVETGPVRAVVEVWRHWGRSTFIQRVIVHRDLPRVDFELDARWFELGGPDHDAPMLRVAFPLNVRDGKFTWDTPFAAVERPTNGQETPAQHWVDLSNSQGGAALMNETKYGHRCTDNVLEMTLLRSGYDPDPYPDQGPHMIRYALAPHKGTWQAAGIAQAGKAYNAPLLAVETPPAPGSDLADGDSLLKLAPAGAVLSAVKQAEDGDGLIIRFHEAHGRSAEAVLTLPMPVAEVQRVNLLEEPIDAPAAKLDGATVRVSVHPHEIVTLRVRM